MKAIIAILIIAAVFAAPTPVENVVEGMKGFLVEINKKGDVIHTYDCVNQIPIFVTKMELLIEDLKKMEWNDVEKIFDAIIDFFEAMKEGVLSLKPCIKVPAEAVTLFNKIGAIDVDKMLKKVLQAAFQLFAWVTEAVRQMGLKNYYEFGSNLGRIVYLVLLQEDAAY